MDLLTVFRTSASAYAFLQSNALLSALADLELEAAKEALVKSRAADDPRLQLTTVLSHLESAEQAAKQSMESIWISGNRPAFERRQSKYSFILGLMAITYYTLQEERLVELTLEKLERSYYRLVEEHRKRPSAYHSLIGFLGGSPKHLIGNKVGSELKFVEAMRRGTIPGVGLNG